MTMTEWERRIRSFDRRVKPSRMGGVRSQILKATVKARRGLPSCNLPGDLVFERLRAKITLRSNPADPQALQILERLRQAERHERLMERKRTQRAAAKRRARRSVLDTCIYLWRRRQEWLRKVEELQGSVAIMDHAATSRGSDDNSE